ncbi:NADPH-dependent F420 reductase [soil metagenome]
MSSEPVPAAGAGSGPDDQSAAAVGLVGGTGPLGRGLAVRFAGAGQRVLLGSRDAGRAADVAATLSQPGRDVVGVTNAQAAGAAVVFVTLPYAAQRGTLPPLAARVAGKVVVSCANPLAFDDGGPRPLRVEAGSAAQECARLLPGARVVGAFQHVPAARLRRVDEPLVCDVLLTGDDGDAKAVVAALAELIPGVRALDAGPLRLTGAVEDMTAVLLSVNIRYSAHTGLRLEGVAR